MGHLSGTLVWEPKVGPQGGNLGQNAKIEPYCGTLGLVLRWDFKVGPYGQT